MIERIIYFSIKNKIIVALFVTALVAWGIFSLVHLPVDAVPDITNNQVQVISQAPSLAVQEMESFITAPIEVAVASIPNIIELRSISRLGLSVVTIVFKEKTDIYWARQQISERLREAEEQIPEGLADIEMAPVSTGLGEIFQYTLEVQKGHENDFSLIDLRTYQDWIVRRQMLGTPGVAEVNSYGGMIKQYEIAVDPARLSAMGISLNDIFESLEKNNENVGSAYIDKKPNAYFIRGIGLVTSLEDIEKIVVKNVGNIPVLISNVATVRYGNAIRYSALVSDSSETVGGVVMMLKGENANEVIKNVKNKIVSIQESLPEGIVITPFLDRTHLVDRAIGTVSRNLIEGALIVIFILVLLLGNLRAGLIVASVIPLSMLFAISMMHFFGISGNLMSLGAIDFGLIVDGAVIIVESVVHRITKSKTNYQGIKILSQKQMDEEVFQASSRIRTAAAFGEIIILIVYIPILALVGIEGKMFRPMGQVVSFAILGAFILSLTWVPMISSLFLSKKTEYKRNISDKIMDFLHKAFHPVILFSLRNKMAVLIISVALFILSIFLFTRLGGEFIPQLEEGDLAALVITLQGGSPTNTVEVVQKANKILRDNFPEIKHIICKIGPGEIPTDPTPMETGDYIITLKDKDEWTTAETREELVEKMEEELAVLAGVKFEFQQPIQLRFNELMTGSRQDVAIKLFGDNLDTLAAKASEIEKMIQDIPGAEDISVEKVTGLAQIHVKYDRARLAQYGLSVSEVNRLLKTAFAGSSAGVVFDEEKRFDLVVRLDREHRQDIADVRSLTLTLPDGTLLPMEQVASVEIVSGPAQVSRENTKRRLTVGLNVRDRDVESVLNDVREQIHENLQLPTGYYISYGGQFENMLAARERLSIAVPVALLLIFVLLFFTFHSLKQSVLIFTAVPMAAIGGVVALWMRDMNFSISAGVGFIALFGVAVLNGIVLIAEFNRLEKDGITDINDRVLKGLKTRLRPVIMTAAVASFGFLPMALSTSAGAEVQKPLATVVIGGLFTSTLLTLFVLPVLYILFTKTNMNKRKISIKQINRTLLILLTIAGLSFFGCKNNTGHDEHSHNATEHAEENDHHDHAENEGEHEELPEDIVEMDSNQIRLAGIQLGNIEMREINSVVSANGIVSAAPQNMASVSAPLGGFLKSSDLIPGSAVKKGQVLALIENPEFIDLQQNYLELKSRYEYAEAEYKRHSELYLDAVYSQKSMQQAATEYKSLKAQIKGLEQKLILIGINPQNFDEDKITSSLPVFSPISGYIKTANVSIGKYVSPTDVIFEIINTEKLLLELSLFEKDANSIEPGQLAHFTINNESHEHKAVIYQVGRSVNTDKTYKVYATVQQPCSNVLPGMYTLAHIEKTGKKVTSLPAEAVVSFENKYYILVFEKDKTEAGQPFTEYRFVEVTTGKTTNSFTEVNLPEDFDIQSAKVVLKGAYNLLSAKKNAGEMTCD